MLSRTEVVSLPPDVTEIRACATVSSQVVSAPEQSLAESVDLSTLTETKQRQVQSLLQMYSSVFSAHEGDLGCTNLVSHDIPLLDEVPVRQRYRRIPPSEYEAVKSHINQLLQN